MNPVGMVALSIFLVAWFGAVAIWFIFAYHMIMLHVRFWQSNPTMQQLLSNIFWFRHGLAGLRSAFDSMPEQGKYHQRKALWAAAKFVGLVAIGVVAGFIGVMWGGWQNLSSH